MKSILGTFSTIRILILMGIICSFARVDAQEFSDLSYTPSDEDFGNPERGFIKYTSTYSDNYSLLTKPQLERYIENDKAFMIWRILYLKDFVDAPISADYLNNLQTDFDLLREVGMKCIIRFAYTDTFVNGFGNPPYNDATPSRILQHIAQLKPILQSNSDVIAVMNAGFVGTWGEWHYTDYYTTSGNLENPNDMDWDNRRELIEALLDALPADRMVQVRFPIAKYRVAESEIPVNESNAYNGSFKSRIGHHNDCFLASSTDFGTYKIDIAAEKSFLALDSKYLAVGGEVCAPSSRTDCTISLEEMERFHWDYMNADYNTAVHNQWKEEGCYEEIRKRLGYRFRLISSKIQNQVQPENTFGIEIKLTNDGFSAPFNPREVEIILRHETNGATYKVKITNVNPQKWYAGDIQTINFEAGIPSTMPHGNYEVFLNLLDPRTSLQNHPNFSMRLANENTWESTTGYNHLQHKIIVNGSAEGTIFGGSDFFTEFIPGGISALSAPDGFEVNLSSSNPTSRIDITWNDMTGETGYTLKRSEDAQNYVEIANLSVDQTNYTDENLKEKTTYYYKLYALDENGISLSSNIKSVTTAGENITSVKKFDPLTSIRIYPNPLKGVLNIEVNLSKIQRVKIKLFDINGRYIDTIHDGVLTKQQNQITWSKHINKGIYLVKIEYQAKINSEILRLIVP